MSRPPPSADPPRSEMTGPASWASITDEIQRLSGMGYWEWDVTRQTILWSRQARRIFDLADDAPISPDDMPQLRAPENGGIETSVIRDALKTGRSWDIELPALTLTGRSFILRSIGHAVREGDRTVRLFGIVRDVTAERQASTEFHRSQSLLHEVSRLSGTGGWELDLQTSTISWSDETYRIYETPEGFVPTPESIRALYSPDVLPILDREMRRTVVGGEDTVVDLHVVTPSGRKKWVQSISRAERLKGRTIRVIGAVKDITEERATAARLEILHARLTAAVSAAELRVWELDPEVNVLRWVSGASPSSVTVSKSGSQTAQEAKRHLHPDDWSRFLEEIRHVTKTSQPLKSRYRLLDSNGRMRHVEFRVQQITSGEGAGRLLGVSRDITAEVEANEELVAKRREAEAASIAKGEFVARMSHEIRTPMNGVIGMLEVLMRSGLTSEQLDHTATALKSARDLMYVLDDVIDVSQLEARHITVDPAPFSAASVVTDVVSLFGARADEKSINLSANIDEAIPASLFGDERRLRQVLTNLVGNALKFTDVGEVTVSASYDDATAKLRLEVSDTGIGVPEGTLGKLFRPFFQADSSRTRRHSGSGLGLSISKQLVEMMGGQIGVESVYGQGSTFWCEIEMQASALPVETNANSSAPAAIRPLRILVAEDNVSSQKILGALLGQEGHTLVFANDGTAAVAMAASDTFDVILMDVMMPLMDGITATRRIRGLGGRSSGVPIIALTANALLGDRDHYLAAGMTDYLSKPIDVSDLFSVIARAAGQN